MTDRRERLYADNSQPILKLQTPQTYIVPKEERVPIDPSNKSLLALFLTATVAFCAIKDDNPKVLPPLLLFAGISTFIGYQKVIGEIGADAYSEKLAKWTPPHVTG